jgi:hypothetical protein
VKEYEPRSAEGIVVRQVLDMQTLRDSVAVMGQAFGGSRAMTDEELARDLENCTQGTRVQRFVAYDEATMEPGPRPEGSRSSQPSASGFSGLEAPFPKRGAVGAYSAISQGPDRFGLVSLALRNTFGCCTPSNGDTSGPDRLSLGLPALRHDDVYW